jgi:signal transduction histidine kinase
MTYVAARVATWPALVGARTAWCVRRLVEAVRRAGVTPAGVDLTLAVVSLVAMLIERVGATAVIGAKMPLAVSLSVVIAAGLALRRRAPVCGYVLGSLALAAESLLVASSPISPYPNLIGIYSLGLYAARGRAWWGPPVAVAGVIAYFGPDTSSLVAPAGALFSWLLSWALGYSTARRREEQQRSRLLLGAEAVVEERMRIARELHDLVGHTVTLMLVQAGAARRILDHDPGQSRELLSTMESTGREALGELDRMLGMLRQAAPGDEPGLASLRELVQRMGRAGIQVTVDSDVAEARLSRSMSMCAYRIIQEALINALKHGHADAARVTLRHTPTTLGLEISDNGRGVPQGYDRGRGLLGIGERVALFGGSVIHGGAEGRGFQLRAALPLG